MDPSLFRVKQETIRMLRNRGYQPYPRSEYPDIENEIQDRLLMGSPQYAEQLIAWARVSPSPIQAKLLGDGRSTDRYMLCQSYIHKSRPNDKCLVYFAEDQRSISLNEIKYFMKVILDFQYNSAILVSKTPLSTEARRDITNIRVPRERTPTNGISNFNDCFIQTFLDDEFIYTPEEHIYVPKHRIMEPQEANDLLHHNKLKLHQLLQIGIDDPIVKRLGALPGEIIEITRDNVIPDTFLDQELSYRVVYMKAPEKKK
jgi:DNA-directed RNA polymerase subunit H (RpoH/RPB5)